MLIAYERCGNEKQSYICNSHKAWREIVFIIKVLLDLNLNDNSAKYMITHLKSRLLNQLKMF